jgi:hypothetical protein
MGNKYIKQMKSEGWPAGARFWYKSKYSDDLIEGVIAKVDSSVYNVDDSEGAFSIVSTTGVWYNSHEIEIENIAELRERKFDDLGI